MGTYCLEIAILNFRTMAAYGLNPRDKNSIPPAIRERHRDLVRGIYKGEKKGYKAWKRFARACAAEGRRLAAGAA